MKKNTALLALVVLLVLPMIPAATEPGIQMPVLIAEITTQGNQYEFSRTYVTAASITQFFNQGKNTIEIRSKEDKRLFAMRIDLESTGTTQPVILEPILERTYSRQVLLPYLRTAYKLVLLDASNHQLAETRVDGLTETTSASLCSPIKNGHCDAACNRDIQDPDCGINNALQQQAAQEFYMVGAALLIPQNQDSTPFVSPHQVFGLLAIVAVVIGLILFGRKIQNERAPPQATQQ